MNITLFPFVKNIFSDSKKINEKSDIFRNLDNKEKFILIMTIEWKLLSKYLASKSLE